MPPRNGVIQKPRNAKGTLRRLGRYLWQSAPLLILALGLSVAGNLFQLIGPTLCGKAIDAVAGGPGKVDFDTVFSYARLMVLFYAASAGLGYLVPQIVLRLSQKTVRMMRADLFAKLMRLPVQYFDTRQTGDILSHISYDIDTVNTSLSNDLVQILTSVITVAGAEHDDPYFAAIGAGVCGHGAAFRAVHPVHDPAGTASVSRPFQVSGRNERLCGGICFRPEDHPGLSPGGGRAESFR